jgi:hypothetical protein
MSMLVRSFLWFETMEGLRIMNNQLAARIERNLSRLDDGMEFSRCVHLFLFLRLPEENTHQIKQRAEELLRNRPHRSFPELNAYRMFCYTQIFPPIRVPPLPEDVLKIIEEKRMDDYFNEPAGIPIDEKVENDRKREERVEQEIAECMHITMYCICFCILSVHTKVRETESHLNAQIESLKTNNEALNECLDALEDLLMPPCKRQCK